ncbi:late embryogenesis abundant protein D-34-like [Rutidosis leptorrhynchoides]|uniref:late embryogenesis abundant protein D-34-like n=1 Tax=Rutidosis leptorrhynchoides TaxID=125765 RepID=UPI003A99DF11
MSREQQPAMKYSDVFPVISGELADKPVGPQDAAMMQAAESSVFGQTQKGGTAAAMQAAATVNERAGLVNHEELTTCDGVSVTATELPGTRVVTETIDGQVVGRHVEATPVLQQTGGVGDVHQQGGITIGEALEATARTAGNKPVEQSDAAAIQAAEVRATGSKVTIPGGLAAQAQSAATLNTSTREEDKVKLNEVLTDATVKLPADKVATREDAEGVFSAEKRNNPNSMAHPAGVAASVAAAANLNERGLVS